MLECFVTVVVLRLLAAVLDLVWVLPPCAQRLPMVGDP